MPTLFRIVNLPFILSAFFVLSCTTSDGEKSDSVSGPTSEDQVSSSSVKEALSSSVAVASSVKATSSSSAVGTSSITATSSSSSVAASSVMEISSSSVGGTSSATATSSSSAIGASSTTTPNTQTCVYSASGTTNGSTGTLTCADENKAYATVVIGTQTWMAENLAWLPSVNGKYDNSSTVAKYHVNGYDSTSMSTAKAKTNYILYGVLYNYQAAIQACPTGWYLPDTTDWRTLEAYVNANNGSKAVGNSLKATTGWTASTGIVNSDDFGFKALPGGVQIDNTFNFIGIQGCWWSATPGSRSKAYYRCVNYNGGAVDSYIYEQSDCFSVRCLKDN